MKLVSKILFFLIVINFSLVHSKPVPDSFADLADKLIPSVVNISTTQTVRTTTNQFPFQFPPGSPFGEMFKDFERPTERKASSLGSGFIIDTKGTVVTNNHVISGADDILVRVGDKEFKIFVSEFIIAIGLIFFVEGLFLAIFPSRIKSILDLIKNTPENKLRFLGIIFLVIGFLIIWYIKS